MLVTASHLHECLNIHDVEALHSDKHANLEGITDVP